MNDSNQQDLVGLEIELNDTATGKQYFQIQHGNKHYKAWINSKEAEGVSGKRWLKKWGIVRLCDYDNCKLCVNGIINK